MIEEIGGLYFRANAGEANRPCVSEVGVSIAFFPSIYFQNFVAYGITSIEIGCEAH